MPLALLYHFSVEDKGLLSLAPAVTLNLRRDQSPMPLPVSRRHRRVRVEQCKAMCETLAEVFGSIFDRHRSSVAASRLRIIKAGLSTHSSNAPVSCCETAKT